MDDLSLDLEKLLTLILFQVIERTALVKNLKIAGLAKKQPKKRTIHPGKINHSKRGNSRIVNNPPIIVHSLKL